jgi:3-phosphoglycerate kinase
VAIVAGSISVLSYLAKEQTPMVLGGVLLAYLVYLMYRIKLGELETEQQDLERVEGIVRTKQKLAELDQK